MPVDALLIVPPLLKVAGAPLLGPAMLAGAARSAGHRVDLMDLNAAWLEPYLPDTVSPSEFVGDHDRPSAALQKATSQFQHLTSACDARGLTHREMLAAAGSLANSEFGPWARSLFRDGKPSVVGISVMYEGQVVAALALSLLARERWCDVRILWGGAHVTALRDEIARDERYGEVIDGFVFGYAEGTWVKILDAIDASMPLPTQVVRAGERRIPSAEDDPRCVPFFDEARPGRYRLTLPAQTSRGCAYGRCAFCTYPRIEGRYRPLELGPALAVVELAQGRGAAVSFKDSLIVPERLAELARAIRGRVSWSACTKLHRALTPAFLRDLAAGGCRTIELGLETLEPNAQRLIDKAQDAELLLRVLDGMESAGLSVVLNYITGFPNVAANAEEAALQFVKDALADRPGLCAKLSRSDFELERLSPMATEDGARRFGIRVTKAWPWSSLLEWEPVVGSPQSSGRGR